MSAISCFGWLCRGTRLFQPRERKQLTHASMSLSKPSFARRQTTRSTSTCPVSCWNHFLISSSPNAANSSSSSSGTIARATISRAHDVVKLGVVDRYLFEQPAFEVYEVLLHVRTTATTSYLVADRLILLILQQFQLFSQEESKHMGPKIGYNSKSA